MKKIKSFFTIGLKLFRIPHYLLVSLGVYLSVIPIAFLNLDSLFKMQSIIPSRPLQNVQAEGIAPEDIHMVVLTHGHPDHIYVIWIWKDDWDFLTSEQAKQKLEEHVREILLKFARENLPPIQGKVDLFDRETEIVPGIRAVAAPGHTPGHMALETSWEGDQLLCISDAVLHPIHPEQPRWYSVVDLAPEHVVTTRRRLLNRVAARKASVHAFHFPFQGFGRVVQKGEGWQWQPMETTG